MHFVTGANIKHGLTHLLLFVASQLLSQSGESGGTHTSHNKHFVQRFYSGSAIQSSCYMMSFNKKKNMAQIYIFISVLISVPYCRV